MGSIRAAARVKSGQWPPTLVEGAFRLFTRQLGVLHRPGVSEAETVISDTEGTSLRLRSRPPPGR